MFIDCNNLRTIYVGDGWTTASMRYTWDMFKGCTSLVGGQGTTYDPNHVSVEYAHLDGGPNNPGYFSQKPAFLRGDVNSDQTVDIDDVAALINYVLNGDASSINMDAAECDQNVGIDIDDVTALLNYVLNGHWN
jgi:hypothetical protein